MFWVFWTRPNTRLPNRFRFFALTVLPSPSHVYSSLTPIQDRKHAKPLSLMIPPSHSPSPSPSPAQQSWDIMGRLAYRWSLVSRITGTVSDSLPSLGSGLVPSTQPLPRGRPAKREAYRGHTYPLLSLRRMDTPGGLSDGGCWGFGVGKGGCLPPSRTRS